MALHSALAKKQWPSPWIVAGQDRLTRDNWGRLDTQLAISMRNRDAFDDVRMTFDAMAEMLEPGRRSMSSGCGRCTTELRGRHLRR